jgi:hypothetical protein
MEPFDPLLRAICFLVAVVLFVLDSAPSIRDRGRAATLGLTALGLAFFVFPFMWDAFAAV